ncbi:MAG: AI-2E family transporter [Halioglobus sp.]|nr:AI-2E family transporter [Halioglobus sp.]|tara:strand:- start:325 stop:1407 length:1083 start_codon:yes stop_codon:yes gene_type:complete
MDKRISEGSNRVVLLLFLGVALYASYILVKPFLQPIVLAILIGMLAYPAHTRLEGLLRGRQSLAALLSCLLLYLCFVIPLTLLLVAVLRQGLRYSVIVSEWATLENVQAMLATPWVQDAREWLVDVLPEGVLEADRIRSQAVTIAGDMGRRFAGVSSSMVGSVTSFFFNFVLMLFVLFFVLRDHDRLLAFLRRALPLSRSQEDVLFEEVREVSKSALLGSLLTAITQGVVGAIALWIVGIPAIFWGTVMAFTSLIPFVGTALVWVPAAIYLALTGQYGLALFMVGWGAVVVGSIDNFLRPLFMQGSSMNTVVVFFSLIGGLHVFGLMGLVYGPLIFSIALVLFRMYESEFAHFLDSQDQN